MSTSLPPSLSITCVAMDNVGKILKDRHLSVNGLLALIHDRHPDCGLPYSILRRLVSHERKMSIDEAILICDALDIPFTALRPRISTGSATPPEPGIRLGKRPDGK